MSKRERCYYMHQHPCRKQSSTLMYLHEEDTTITLATSTNRDVYFRSLLLGLKDTMINTQAKK